MKTTISDCQLRWLVSRDLKEVLAIENASFSSHWTEEEFILRLKRQNCIGSVAELGYKRILGFMVYELYKSRLHIINFVIDPNFRRRGVGSQMVQRLIDKLPLSERTEIDVKVHEANVQAQLFFQSLGFKAVKILKDHYEDTKSAYLMVYKLGENPDA